MRCYNLPMIQNLFQMIKPIVSNHETWPSTKSDMAIHSHNTLELVYVQSGIMKIEFETDTADTYDGVYVSKGQIGVIFPHTNHRILVGSDSVDFDVLELEFINEPDIWNFLRRKTFLSGHPSFVKLAEKAPKVLSLSDTQDVRSVLQRLSAISFDYFNNKQDYFFEAEYTILLQRLLLSMGKCLTNRAAAQSNHYINKCILLIQDKFNEKLSVKYLSEKLGISPSYLQRLFKKKFGKTVLETINDFRLTQAEKLLVTTKMSLNDIAQVSGFSSGTFYLNFTKKYGASPSEYRKLHAQKVPTFNNAVFSHYFDYTPLLEN